MKFVKTVIGATKCDCYECETNPDIKVRILYNKTTNEYILNAVETNMENIIMAVTFEPKLKFVAVDLFTKNNIIEEKDMENLIKLSASIPEIKDFFNGLMETIDEKT